MSKSAPGNKPSKKQVKPHKQKSVVTATQQSKKEIVVFVIVAVLAAIPFFMGKYMEFNTPGPYDSGAYVYSAKHILDGAKIGVDEKPSAQPGTLLVNMLGVRLFGFNETGPKLIQAILQAAALALMFIAMAKLFGTLPAAVSVIIASVYLSAPLIAKFGNVKEQYMIAFMVIGISCFVLRQLGGGWWWSVLAGAFVIWAPLFKQTGVSALGAIGLFVVAQPFLKNRTWKQTTADIGLLLAGAGAALAPVYIWLLAADAPRGYMPYAFVLKMLPQIGRAGQAKAAGGYISKSREMFNLAKQFPIVMRYYKLLILPIALAVGSIVTGIGRMVWRLKIGNRESKVENGYDRFVLLFAVWWLLDMAFVWISPRSYEQYYLPLNASAAMLGGYVIALYRDEINIAVYHKSRWVIAGLVGLLLMIVMLWPIFFGIKRSPYSGQLYGKRMRGYAQRLEEIAMRKKQNAVGAWEAVGEYIRNHSTPDDKIYVWGWVPGIYIKAQRLSSATKAFEGTMHTLSPKELSERIGEILGAFEKKPPKFIVDTRKQHFPWDRPPLELWPRTQKGFLSANKQIIDAYDAAYSKMLREKIEPDEALRYEAMQPFREFVMKNYKIVRPFGQHILFEHK